MQPHKLPDYILPDKTGYEPAQQSPAPHTNRRGLIVNGKNRLRISIAYAVMIILPATGVSCMSSKLKRLERELAYAVQHNDYKKAADVLHAARAVPGQFKLIFPYPNSSGELQYTGSYQEYLIQTTWWTTNDEFRVKAERAFLELKEQRK